MSLLTEYMEECIMLDKISVPDGYGGAVTQYKDGAPFIAAIALMGPTEIIAAQQRDVKASYKITTGRELNLQYHDVFRRVRDGKVFRVTSDGDDNYTPKSAGLNMRQVNAEEWNLTNAMAQEWTGNE